MTEIRSILNTPSVANKFKRLNVILSQPPKEEWIQDHKFAKRTVNGKEEPVQYIPIGIIEDTLRDIFGMFLITVKQVQHLHNSVAVTLTLRLPSPLNDGPGIEWLETDGLGGYPIFDGSYGVQMALPAAKSFAIKDAAETLGKIFGSDINRQLDDPEMGFEVKAKVTPEILNRIKLVQTVEGITNIYEEFPMLHSNPEFTDALKEQRLSFNKK